MNGMTPWRSRENLPEHDEDEPAHGERDQTGGGCHAGFLSCRGCFEKRGRAARLTRAHLGREPCLSREAERPRPAPSRAPANRRLYPSLETALIHSHRSRRPRHGSACSGAGACSGCGPHGEEPRRLRGVSNHEVVKGRTAARFDGASQNALRRDSCAPRPPSDFGKWKRKSPRPVSRRGPHVCDDGLMPPICPTCQFRNKQSSFTSANALSRLPTIAGK